MLTQRQIDHGRDSETAFGGQTHIEFLLKALRRNDDSDLTGRIPIADSPLARVFPSGETLALFRVLWSSIQHKSRLIWSALEQEVPAD
jgi:hypothetical protein